MKFIFKICKRNIEKKNNALWAKVTKLALIIICSDGENEMKQRETKEKRNFLIGVYITTGIFFLTGIIPLHAGWQIDFETGVVISGYNDVRIPGDTGTKISLSKELETDPKLFFRGRLTYILGKRHTFSVFAAPLRLYGNGKVDRAITFQEEVFPPNTDLKVLYRFDSYRLTYRYDFLHREKFQLGLGFTGKIRDAEISLESSTAMAIETNTGFVPLINFRAEWVPWEKLGFLLEGDALAAPQGRAEDVLVALKYSPVESVALKFGYRILEGGADNDTVYTFALLNYIVIGTLLSF